MTFGTEWAKLAAMPAPSPLPPTFLLNSPYVSLAKVSSAYRSLLADLNCLAPHLAAAQVVIINDTFDAIAMRLVQMPALRHKICVGLVVRECTRLPADAFAVLPKLTALWTPSWYSARSMVPHHAQVMWLPHVVPRTPQPTAADVSHIDALLGPRGACNLLQVGDLTKARKGRADVEHAVLAAACRLPGLRLTCKFEDPNDPVRDGFRVRHAGPVTTLEGPLCEGLMAALYARHDFVVSGHHGEGWGLTLTEGMGLGVPAIAPAYSGNMAYMTAAAGILVPAGEEPVRDVDASANYNASMRWGYCLPGQMQMAIERAYALVGTAAYARMSRAARTHAGRFDARHVRPLLRQHLRRLGATATAGAARA